MAVIMLDPETGTVNQYGSNQGVQFLFQNDAISLKFLQFFGKLSLYV